MVDVLVFYEEFYVFNNVILIVVGDVEFEEVCVLVDKYYGVILVNFDLKLCVWM